MMRTVLTGTVILLCALALIIGCGAPPGEREFRQALREIDRGNYVRAKVLLEKSVNRRPGSDMNAAVYNYLGLVFWKLGQGEQAIEAFDESHRLNPALPEPVYNLGVLYFESGDFTRAGKFFADAAELNPADSRPLEYLGRILARSGKWPEARRALFGALARAPLSPRVLTSLALVERSISGNDKAIFYLMQALDKKPDYAPALFDLGFLYFSELKQPKQAVDYFKKFLKVADDTDKARFAKQVIADLESDTQTPTPPASKPSNPSPPSEPVKVREPVAALSEPAQPQTVDDMLNEAKSDAEKGLAQKALNLCVAAAGRAERAQDEKAQEKALRKAVELCFDQAPAHYALGRFLLDQRQTTAAANSFKQALVLDPKYTLAYLGLAEASVQSEEYDSALVSIKQAVQLEPGNSDALWALASLYDQQLDIEDRAAKCYSEFIDRFPADARVLKAQERLKALGRAPTPAAEASAPTEPVASAAAAGESQPSPAAAGPERHLEIRKSEIRDTHAAVQAYNRGISYQRQENWDTAIYFYTRALENDGTFAAAYFNLGAVYMAKHDYNLAKESYERAIELRPDVVAAHYNLALIHRELGEKELAIERLEEIVKNEPDYAAAYYVLGLIQSENRSTYEQAKMNYEKFLNLAPNDPSAASIRKWIDSH